MDIFHKLVDMLRKSGDLNIKKSQVPDYAGLLRSLQNTPIESDTGITPMPNTAPQITQDQEMQSQGLEQALQDVPVQSSEGDPYQDSRQGRAIDYWLDKSIDNKRGLLNLQPKSPSNRNYDLSILGEVGARRFGLGANNNYGRPT